MCFALFGRRTCPLAPRLEHTETSPRRWTPPSRSLRLLGHDAEATSRGSASKSTRLEAPKVQVVEASKAPLGSLLVAMRAPAVLPSEGVRNEGAPVDANLSETPAIEAALRTALSRIEQGQ